MLDASKINMIVFASKKRPSCRGSSQLLILIENSKEVTRLAITQATRICIARSPLGCMVLKGKSSRRLRSKPRKCQAKTTIIDLRMLSTEREYNFGI